MSKIIVITGAGAGLGRTLARRFASDGDKVVLLGRTLSKVQAVADELGGGAMAVACDVANPDSVRAAFAEIAKRHPKIDVLINNAAHYQPFPIAEGTDEQIIGIISTNLIGAFFCARSAIPMMGCGGHIINVSSESVDIPFPYLLTYQTSKAGLERFSLGLGEELAPSGIRVTTIQAGPMHEEGKGWDVDPEMAKRFHEACAAVGMNLRTRPNTHFESLPGVFRAVIDMAPDLNIQTLTLRARAKDK